MTTKTLPPLALVMLIAAAMKILAWSTPWLTFSHTSSLIIASLCFIIGCLPMACAAYLFICAKTTVNPTAPQHTSTLITHGIYRYSRNPMYVSFLLLLIGWSFWLGNIITLLGVVAVYWHLDRHQIPREESALNKKFTRHFTHYCLQTKRWF